MMNIPEKKPNAFTVVIPDVHTRTAAEYFRVPASEVTPTQRALAQFRNDMAKRDRLRSNET